MCFLVIKDKTKPIRIDKMKIVPHIIQPLFILTPRGLVSSVLNIIARINPPIYPITVATETILLPNIVAIINIKILNIANRFVHCFIPCISKKVYLHNQYDIPSIPIILIPHRLLFFILISFTISTFLFFQ